MKTVLLRRRERKILLGAGLVIIVISLWNIFMSRG